MPSGVAIDLDSIIGVTQSLGGFLFILGGILASLTIIISGIMYFFGGSSQQKVATAKGILKAGLIGALIIFGVGTIITFIKGFASNPLDFFKK